jgi:hypothetical protein
MTLVHNATPEAFGKRILGAVDALPDAGLFGQKAFNEADHFLRTMVNVPELKTADLLRAESVLRNIIGRFGAYAAPAVQRGPQGRPLPPLGAQFKFLAFTDCVGEDPETASRIAIEEGSALAHLGMPGGQLHWQQTEPLNPAHIRGSVTSAYLAYLQKVQADPEQQTEQLVILANAAPRDPQNPDAKGCPFVVAVLEGNVFYVGTLNGGGTELQGIKPYVKELWHTTLGVEETGVEGGKAPKSVFRSKHLLPLFRELTKGNEALLDRKLCIEQSIEPIAGIQIDSRDSFGNLKTTASFQQLLQDHNIKIGTTIDLRVGNKTVIARIAQSHGDGLPSEVLVVPGSSPYDASDESNTRADIVVNHGDASQQFLDKKEPFGGRVWAGKEVMILGEHNPMRRFRM